MYVYFCSLHVSASHVPIIRRINCINTTSGICHSLLTVWCAGLDETASHPNRYGLRLQIRQIQFRPCKFNCVNITSLLLVFHKFPEAMHSDVRDVSMRRNWDCVSSKPVRTASSNQTDTVSSLQVCVNITSLLLVFHNFPEAMYSDVRDVSMRPN